MLTIREIKARTETFFQSKGVPSPRLDTDILIAHSLGLKRLELYLDMDRPLTDAQLAELRPLVRRRGSREPLQYIIGTVEFCDLMLKVDSRALIPRPETEELFALVCAARTCPPQTVLDLGTGTGALALAFAHKYPEAGVFAVDASGDALALARDNAARLGLAARVQFYEGNWFEPLEEAKRFDLIVSNPPYLTEAEMRTAEPEVVDYEPGQALVSGKDGLDDLERIVKEAPRFLNPDGLLALETGIAQEARLGELAAEAGLESRTQCDLSGRPRFFFATRRK